MTFGRPEWIFILLAALPPLLLLSWWAGKSQRRRLQAVLGTIFARNLEGYHPSGKRWRHALVVTGLMLCCVALARPEYGFFLRKVVRRGIDIMIVLDTSNSMLAEDLAPNRLKRAKRDITGMVKLLKGDRIGLVAFSGSARLVCPPTHDYAAFLRFLDTIDTFTNDKGGTAISKGLDLAIESLNADKRTNRAVVVITDGEDHDSDPPPTEIAYKANLEDILIYTLAMGQREGAKIPVRTLEGQTYFVTDENGKDVISKPNEAMLSEIAKVGGGEFLSAADTAFPLDEIYQKRLQQIEARQMSEAERRQAIDRYQLPLMACFLAFAVESVLKERRKERRR